MSDHNPIPQQDFEAPITDNDVLQLVNCGLINIDISVSPQIKLIPVNKSHAPALYSVIKKNRSFLSYYISSFKNIISVYETQKLINFYTNMTKRGDGVHLLIVYINEDSGHLSIEPNEDNICGIISYHHMDIPGRTVELGYWLAQSATGKGVMTKSVEALVEYAFESLALSRVKIQCAASNVKSQAVAKRCGFKFIKLKKQAEWLVDHFEDHYQFTRVKDKYSYQSNKQYELFQNVIQEESKFDQQEMIIMQKEKEERSKQNKIRFKEQVEMEAKRKIEQLEKEHQRDIELLKYKLDLAEFTNDFFICDGCEMHHFKGSRYHCLKCPDFDYCEYCYRTKRSEHKHNFAQYKPLALILTNSKIVDKRIDIQSRMTHLEIEIKVYHPEMTLKNISIAPKSRFGKITSIEPFSVNKLSHTFQFTCILPNDLYESTSESEFYFSNKETRQLFSKFSIKHN